MAKTCSVKVQNKLNSMLVVANSILSPKFEIHGPQDVTITNERQVNDILSAERQGMLKLRRPVPLSAAELYPILGEVEHSTGEDTKDEESVEESTAEESTAEESTEQAASNEESSVEEIVEENIEQAPFLGIDQIEEMTGKDLKAFIAKYNLDIKGYSSMTTRDLKDAMLTHYGHEVPSENPVIEEGTEEQAE